MKKSLKKIAAGLMVAVSMLNTFALNVLAVDTQNNTAEAVSVCSSTATSSKKNGWYSNSKGEKYYFVNGEMVKNKVQKIDGKLYLFGKTGKLLKNGGYVVNDNTYFTDSDGRVKCNQWVASKTQSTSNTYYYAQATGKAIKYEFKKCSGSYSLVIYDLYINDKKAKESDLSNGSALYMFSKDIYYLRYSTVWEKSGCVQADDDPYFFGTKDVYDFATRKKVGEFLCYGEAFVNSKNIINQGTILKTDGYLYKIQGEGKSLSKSRKASSIIIVKSSTDMNSVGGFSYSNAVYNNSNKTIKYIHYTVHVENGVYDTVSDDISRKSVFQLKDTGPYEPGTITSGTWENIMYNYSARYLVIDSVTVDYMDGTSITISGSNLSI